MGSRKPKPRKSVTYRIYLDCGHTDDFRWLVKHVKTLRLLPKKGDTWTCPVDGVKVYVDSAVKLKVNK